MMLTAAAAAVALTVTVSAAPDISPTLVTRVVAEADEVWRHAGFAFAWERTCDAVETALHVVIGHDSKPAHDGGVALGWIVFEDSKPDQEIYISYENVAQFMSDAQGIVGPIARMPQLERETLLARAMGRALAHEMGHYLLSSKMHTLSGLMQANRTAAEFFGADNRQFKLDGGQRNTIAERLTRRPNVANP